MGLCKYKNLFGIPNTGVHSIRIFDIAIIHIFITLLEAILIYEIIIVQWLKINNIIKLWMVIVFMFVLGIVLHKAFCVKTTVDKILFGE